MRLQIFVTAFLLSFNLMASEKITSVDFVEILNDKREEALFYYKNNWEKYRKQAQQLGYIESYMLLQTQPTEDAPFHLMLITTYPNQQAFDQREEHFQPLIAAGGGLKLLNEAKPPAFRKTLFYVDGKNR